MTDRQCGRCGKTRRDGIHTCTPTEWARKMEVENEALKKENLRLLQVMKNAWDDGDWLLISNELHDAARKEMK